MNSIIEVKNLGKKYNITHQQGGYVALRDVLTNVFKNPFQFAKHKAKQITGQETKEEFWALKDINFTIEKGEAIGIIGANGAGKSTLLKILTGITPPTTGEAIMRGKVASLLEVGTGFHPELSGRENIFLNGAILGMTKKEISDKFNDIVKFSGVEKFLDTPIKYYSSGMSVRLAFSVAAHLEPDILIIDEVLAVGDADFQKKCLRKMDEITKKNGRTILFVSHNMATIRQLCGRCILLKDGEIKMIGETNGTLDTYLNQTNKENYIKEWTDKIAPQNNSIILKKIALVNVNGQYLNTLSVGQPFAIEIEYNIKDGRGTTGFTLGFWGDNNNLIFISISNFKNNFYNKKLTQGLYKTRCLIPANLLNNGILSLSLSFFEKNFANSISLNPVLIFKITDSHVGRGDYTGNYPGVIRPVLDWDTELIK
ncbi:MAG: polysaccharide ABC transporter ATP-binding protein [Patescibacteria group bacterium]